MEKLDAENKGFNWADPVKVWQSEKVDIDFILPSVSRGRVGMLYGNTNARKSELLMQEAVKIAAGKPSFFGQTPKPRKVAYVSFGDHPNLMHNYLKNIIEHLELTENEVKNTHFNMTASDRISLVDKEVNIDLSKLLELVGDLKVDLLILSPFSWLHELDEDNNQHMNLLMQAIEELARTLDCAVLIAHESIPDGTWHRGNVAISNYSKSGWRIGKESQTQYYRLDHQWSDYEDMSKNLASDMVTLTKDEQGMLVAKS